MVPRPLVLPAITVCGWCKLSSDLDPHTCKSNSNWSSSMQIRPNLHFQFISQVDLRWPLTLICDLLTPWTFESSHIMSINQVWFKSDFNLSNKTIFTFSAYLTTWPQMTFDLGICPLTAWTYEGSHFLPINQVWFQSDFNFSNEATFTFLAYLTTCP